MKRDLALVFRCLRRVEADPKRPHDASYAELVRCLKKATSLLSARYGEPAQGNRPPSQGRAMVRQDVIALARYTDRVVDSDMTAKEKEDVVRWLKRAHLLLVSKERSDKVVRKTA